MCYSMWEWVYARPQDIEPISSYVHRPRVQLNFHLCSYIILLWFFKTSLPSFLLCFLIKFLGLSMVTPLFPFLHLSLFISSRRTYEKQKVSCVILCAIPLSLYSCNMFLARIFVLYLFVRFTF